MLDEPIGEQKDLENDFQYDEMNNDRRKGYRNYDEDSEKEHSDRYKDTADMNHFEDLDDS